MYFCFQNKKTDEALEFHAVKRMFIDVKFGIVGQLRGFYHLETMNGDDHWISMDEYQIVYVSEKY